MAMIAETDQDAMVKLTDELMHLRSREACALALEVAYGFGRRTGSKETADALRQALGIAPTEPPAAVQVKP